MTDERYGEVKGPPSPDLKDYVTEPPPYTGLPDDYDPPGDWLPPVYGFWEQGEDGAYHGWDEQGNHWKIWKDSQGHLQTGYTDKNGAWHDADPYEFAPPPNIPDLVEEPAPAPPVPDPGPMQKTLDDVAQAGVEGEVSPTEEAKGTAAHDGPDPNAPAQPRTDASDAHQPGGFHPSYENQWPYGEIRPEEGVEAWPYGEVRPPADEDSLRLDPDPAAPALPPPDPGAPRIASDQADPNPSLSGVEGEVNPEAVNPWPYGEESALNPWQNPWIMEPPEPVDVIVNSDPKPPPPWPYGEVRPTEDAQEPWPYGETNPTGAASFLEQSDAGMGLGDLADPRLTEDPSTAVHPEVQEQEDFFEGV